MDAAPQELPIPLIRQGRTSPPHPVECGVSSGNVGISIKAKFGGLRPGTHGRGDEAGLRDDLFHLRIAVAFQAAVLEIVLEKRRVEGGSAAGRLNGSRTARTAALC